MIGPRSALFTPFPNLGVIIIDEEHEAAYKSETVPRYHARETAIARGMLCGAHVVLGSATPSVTDGIYSGSAGRIKEWKPVDPQRQAAETDDGPAGEKGTDHAVFEPQGCGRFCILPFLR